MVPIYSRTTGGHNWFPFSSKSKQLDDGRIQVLRYGAWVTSAGFADFYVVESTSPSYGGDFMNLSLYLMFQVTFGCLYLPVHTYVDFQKAREKR